MDTNSFWVLVAVVVLVYVIYKFAKKKSDEQFAIKRLDTLYSELKTFVDRVFESKEFPSVNSPNVALHDGEFVIRQETNIPLMAYHTERVGTGFRVGGRIMKGVWVGQSQWHSQPVQVKGVQAVGELILTNQRLIFVSLQRSLSIPWKNLLSFDTDNTVTFDVSATNSKTPFIFVTPNPVLWTFMTKWISTVKPTTRQLDTHMVPQSRRRRVNAQNFSRASLISSPLLIRGGEGESTSGNA